MAPEVRIARSTETESLIDTPLHKVHLEKEMVWVFLSHPVITQQTLRRCNHQTSELHLENVEKMTKKCLIIQLFTNILDTVLLNYCYYY